MRFIIQLSLTDQKILSGNVFVPAWVNELLPVHNNGRVNDLIWDTFTYKTDDKSIVEANWDKPYFSNADYFVFIGGHVFYRINEADIAGKYVPTPEEVLQIILLHGGDHYRILKGDYHILVFYKRHRTLTIFTSPLSLYPAWYFKEDGRVTVSNMMESLLRMKKEVSVDPQGLVEFTLFDHCIGSRTLYNDIIQLSGGLKTEISEKESREELFYDISKWKTDKPVNRKESLSEIDMVLKRHIDEFVKSVKKFNISLTGGFDGRLNFSFINKADYKRLQAFSYGMKESLQLQIPKRISKKLNFRYKAVILDKDFKDEYPGQGLNSILYTGGVSPFTRANYPYGYGKVNDFSRNCILGQCDFIRPLYTNPAGAIFNNFSHDLFYEQNPSIFYDSCSTLSKSGFLAEDLFSNEIIEKIYKNIKEKYILPYPELSNDERYYFFLMKESMVKFWQTECHLVDLFVNDFISFSDLDYIEVLSGSKYFGLYKGIFATNQIKRRNGQDLYADLMYINNNELNKIIVDRFYKPKWIRIGLLGYFMIALGKMKANYRKRIKGNDTFAGAEWSDLFYRKFGEEINREALLFNSVNLKKCKPYPDNNTFRYDRHISLKLWLQYMNLI